MLLVLDVGNTNTVPPPNQQKPENFTQKSNPYVVCIFEISRPDFTQMHIAFM